MRARATAAVLLTVLGGATALAVTTSRADPPVTGEPATVYKTVVETQTVHARYQGRTVRWWAKRAIANRRLELQRRITLQRIQTRLRARWQPTVTYAIGLAARVFNIDEAKMRQVAWCESTMRPWATNGRYKGLFQLGWSPYGLSPFDPVANALSTAQTVARDGSWRQWECG